MELQDIVKWNVEDGDVLFFNADCVDALCLRDSMRGLGINKNIILVPVYCALGTSISEAVAVLQTKDIVV